MYRKYSGWAGTQSWTDEAKIWICCWRIYKSLIKLLIKLIRCYTYDIEEASICKIAFIIYTYFPWFWRWLSARHWALCRRLETRRRLEAQSSRTGRVGSSWSREEPLVSYSGTSPGNRTNQNVSYFICQSNADWCGHEPFIIREEIISCKAHTQICVFKRKYWIV